MAALRLRLLRTVNAASLPAPCAWTLARSMSDRPSAGIPEPPAKPNYYAVLGVSVNASADAIKAAFREQAKLLHPDVLARGGGAATADVDAFKLVNEAYSVLSDPVLRRRYDADSAGFDRVAMLRRRNEGWEGAGTAAVDPSTSLSDLSITPEERAEALRSSMARAAERVKEGARMRASLARINRAKISMPSREESYAKLAYPLAIVALWAFNYVVFMR